MASGHVPSVDSSVRAAEFNLTEVAPKISLYHAVRDNYEDIVMQWMNYYKKRPSVLDEQDSDGYTALHYAAKFNRFKILKMLIEAGAGPNCKTREEHFTALHFAARYIPQILSQEVQQQEFLDPTLEVTKHSTSIQAMVYLANLRGDKRVEVNAKSLYNKSALHLACQVGNSNAVSVLLRCSNIDVNIADAQGYTPLHEACTNGHVNIVDEILVFMNLVNKDKMNINPQNSDGLTPLHLACRKGYVSVVKTLLQHVGGYHSRATLTQTRDNKQNLAIHHACESGKSEIVHILALHNADLSAVKMDGVSPLHIAARYGFIDLAEMLLMGCPINAIDDHSRTPLHYAASYNQFRMIKFLIEHEADVSTTDTEAYTPLMLAAAAGHVEAFNMLLEKGASIDAVDAKRRSVIHLAAEKKSVDVLKCAIMTEQGSLLVNSMDSDYNTPLHIAALNGNIDCVEAILKLAKLDIKADERNELYRTPMHLAASNGHADVIEALIKFQRDCIADEDENGETSLHLACVSNHYKAAEVLLENQAYADSKNAKLWTPVHNAAAKGHAKVVQVLLEAGCDVNPTDRQLTTPIHLAAQEGHLHVVQILLDYDADVGQCDKSGLNSLDLAIDNGHEDVAMAIVKSDRWKSALSNCSTTPKKEKTTPLRKCIESMPEVAREVFGRCCERSTGRRDGLKYQVEFNYEFLEDFDVPHDKTWGPGRYKKDLHPLSILVKHECTDLLNHPLIKSLLKLKLRLYGYQMYIINLILFAIFLIFLTSFALVSLNPQSQTCQSALGGDFGRAKSDLVMYENNTDDCDSVTLNMSNASSDGILLNGTEVCASEELQLKCGLSRTSCGICDGQSFAQFVFLYFAAVFVEVYAVAGLIHRAYQLFHYRLHAVFDMAGWMSITSYICTICFTFAYFTECLCHYEWQWQLGCAAVFLSWISFILFVREMPVFGLYVLMFVHIFYTFCKVIFLTLLLVVAFSLAFYMALYDPNGSFVRSSFASPGRALVKTMTMTTGEFEYDAIFRQFPGGAEEGSITTEVPFLPVSFVLWIIFLAIMPILLTNLLVGLAVDDIKGIRGAAVLKKLSLQVEFALRWEEQIPFLWRRFLRKHKRRSPLFFPNRNLTLLEQIRYNIFGDQDLRFDNPDNIFNALHQQLTPVEEIQDQTSDLVLDMKQMKASLMETSGLVRDVKQMKDTVSELAKKNALMEKLLYALAKKEDIKVEEVDRSYI